MYLFAVFLIAWPFVASCASLKEYGAALEKIDWVAVKEDLKKMLVNSRDFWPADYGNYGPFMIRQAWHCSGSYRSWDGRGGCSGGRQRFEPERSWDDNTNLDKAKTLLLPIKIKYGLGLSWGDLIILAANVAIESMGGPVLGFCAGRPDDYDGSASTLLGPDSQQNSREPCVVNGECKKPFGTTTIGLIYVNPAGPMGKPLPEASALEVRDVFSRMTHDDIDTVALIGGGHAFGKTHGACPLGPGLPPKDDPQNPWAGKCGSGKGNDTYTSGFEGAWSVTPTRWNNNYFKELVFNKWKVYTGPGGLPQWKTVDGTQGVMMLTTDISLLHDPMGVYQPIVHLFATNQTALDEAFAYAWYKLTTRDSGPVTRCTGPWVPPVQDWQYPLPPTPSKLPDFDAVKSAIRQVINSDYSVILPPDYYNGKPYYGAIFVHLAWQCATTFRATDHLGGCNGARIRFAPQSSWPHNIAMDKALQILQPVHHAFVNLSWADLIVLAGNVALEMASGQNIPFCPGRTDATDGKGSQNLQPNGNWSASNYDLQVLAQMLELSPREMVALSARLRSPSQIQRTGYYGSWTANPTLLSNEYFTTLLTETWVPFSVQQNIEYVAQGKQLYMVPSDLWLRWDDTFLSIATEFASDNTLFVKEFISAWVKVMNLDRFDGPTGNLCSK